MSENESRLIAEFDKNSLELVRIHLTRWRNTDYVDIRTWVKGEPGCPGGERPTTRGIRLNGELLGDLIRALTEARQVLEGRPEVEVVQDGSQDKAEALDAGPDLDRLGRDTGKGSADA